MHIARRGVCQEPITILNRRCYLQVRFTFAGGNEPADEV